MRILSLVLCTLVILATGLPLINTTAWWIRIFDFPRFQIAAFTFIALILAYIYIDFKWKYKLPLLIILLVSIVYQVQFVVVYTPLFKTQAKDFNQPIGPNSFTLLVSNVRMDNEEKERFHALIKTYNPDILLINEPDHVWAESIGRLDTDFPHSVKYPLDNTYGMMLLSKLPLTGSSVNFLVKESVPSIFTKITLPSGRIIDFYGVHPEPPMPGTDTWERDTELLIIGRRIRESDRPTIVAGDLNDVGWSVTSKLFRKYSGLVDPREGRGMFNTYNAFIPLFRYPLDHIFYSTDFGLIALKKLEHIGSDHFPILVALNFEPDDDNAEDQDETGAGEEAEVEEKIEDGMDKGNEN